MTPRTNQEFLEAIFGDQWERAHVCAVPGDPTDPTTPRSVWRGGPAKHVLAECRPDTNNYFAVSLFKGAHRRLDEWVGFHLLGIDDVGPKVDPAKVRALLGEPSYRLETSPGNEQWGYRLAVPMTYGDGAKALQEAVRRRLTGEDAPDPGMLGLTRYLRLPVGVNLKPALGPNGYVSRMLEWRPDRTFSPDDVEALAQNLGGVKIDGAPGIPTGVSHNRQQGDLTLSEMMAKDPVLRALQDLDLVQDGPRNSTLGQVMDIDCPWMSEHTDRAASGTVYAPVRTKFKCQHGHCFHRTNEHLRIKVDELLREDSGGLKGLADYEFTEIDPATLPPGVVGNPDDHDPDELAFLEDTIYVSSAIRQKYWSVSRRIRMDDAAFDQLWSRRLRRVLPEAPTSTPAKPRKLTPAQWYRAHAHMRRADDMINWPGGEVLVERQGQTLANRWVKPEVREVTHAVADQEVNPWLVLVHHVIGCDTMDEAENLEIVLDWMAMVAGSYVKPGWHVLVMGTQGLGKDVIVAPLQRGLGAMATEINGGDLTSSFNPWAQGRLVQVNEIRQTSRGSATPHDQANSLKLADNSREVVWINEKGIPRFAAHNVFCLWLSSNESVPLKLDRADRRFLVFDRLNTPVRLDLLNAYLDFLERDAGGGYVGWELVHAWLVQRWVSMPDHRRQVLVGRAPMTEAKSAMIDRDEDEVTAWMRRCIEAQPPAALAWPDVVWPLWVSERLNRAASTETEGLNRRTSRPNVDQIGRRLAELGATKLANNQQVRISGLQTRLWAVRNSPLYEGVGPADLARVAEKMAVGSNTTDFDA